MLKGDVEEFGDGIWSALDFNMSLEPNPIPI
jgi:cyanate lyase